MVLGNVLCAINLASTVMANGVCCFYEMQREEDRKKEQQENIRQSIHSEWERQRFVEMIQRQQEKEILVGAQQVERRQKLMMTKQKSRVGAERTHASESQNSTHREQPGSAMRSDAAVQHRIPSFGPAGSETSTFSARRLQSKSKDEISHEMKVHSFRIHTTGNGHEYPERQLSSLMDDDSEDELEEICLV